MSYTFRVYPQPHSIGARRNRAMKRQIAQQAQFNRLQNLQLQRQLGAFTPGGNAYGRSVSQFPGQYGGYGSYGSAYGNAGCFPTQTAYTQGYGYGAGLGYGSAYGLNNPFQYAVAPAYTGVSSLFGGLFNNWL